MVVVVVWGGVDGAPLRSFGERRVVVGYVWGQRSPLVLVWRAEGGGWVCVWGQLAPLARLESGGWWWGVWGIDETPSRSFGERRVVVGGVWGRRAPLARLESRGWWWRGCAVDEPIALIWRAEGGGVCDRRSPITLVWRAEGVCG